MPFGQSLCVYYNLNVYTTISKFILQSLCLYYNLYDLKLIAGNAFQTGDVTVRRTIPNRRKFGKIVGQALALIHDGPGMIN